MSGQRRPGKVDPLDLVVCGACCCALNSLYLTFPECIGCYTNQTVCCLTWEGVGCKPSNIEGECCVLQDCNCTIVYPTTCCKGVQQCCCFDQRISFPCDSDVPCAMGYFGLVCCLEWRPKIACCLSLRELRGDDQSLLSNVRLSHQRAPQQQLQYPTQPQPQPQPSPFPQSLSQQKIVQQTEKSTTSLPAEHRISFAESYPASAFDEGYEQPDFMMTSAKKEDPSPYANLQRMSGALEQNPMALLSQPQLSQAQISQAQPSSPMQRAPRPNNPLTLKPIVPVGGAAARPSVRRSVVMPPGQIATPQTQPPDSNSNS